jgi:hypothetical protein
MISALDRLRLRNKVGSVAPGVHIPAMVRKSRSRTLDVSVTADRPPRWEWQLTCGGELIANGFEDGRIQASFEGYNAMFQLLATGWNP